MNASSSRNGKFDSSLIRKPRQQPRLQRTLWGGVNLVFWAFLFYLWAPLLTLLSWLVGAHLAWQQLYEYQDEVDPFLLLAVPLILVCCSVLMIAWAEYNRMRFAGKERRSPIDPITVDQVALDLGATPELARELLGSKSMILHMDDSARPIGFTRQLSS